MKCIHCGKDNMRTHWPGRDTNSTLCNSWARGKLRLAPTREDLNCKVCLKRLKMKEVVESESNSGKTD